MSGYDVGRLPHRLGSSSFYEKHIVEEIGSETGESDSEISQTLDNLGKSNDRRLPVMIFCHGLGGMRTTYASICMEMASFGYIVFAIEHSDGTAAACVRSVDASVDVIYYEKPPLNEEEEREFRKKQLAHRRNEVYNLLVALKEDDLDEFKGRMDLENLILCGHSFGGATVFESWIHFPEMEKVSVTCLIAFDPWMFALEWPKGLASTDNETSSRVHIPILVLHSEFFEPVGNLDSIDRFMNIFGLPGSSFFILLKGVGHMSASDLCVELPSWLSYLGLVKTQFSCDPTYALWIQLLLMRRFILLANPTLFLKSTFKQLEEMDGYIQIRKY